LHSNFECMEAAIMIENAVYKVFNTQKDNPNNNKVTEKYLKEINRITFTQVLYLCNSYYYSSNYYYYYLLLL